MSSVLVIPLCERRGHMHLLDDIATAHAGVIGTEGYFAFLRRVRNNALLGATEIIVEQILKPHPRYEQEVPTIRAPFLDIFNRSIPAHLAVVFARGAERLVE